MDSIENQAKQWVEAMKQKAPKPAPKAESVKDAPAYDDLGRPVHYSLEEFPPGSVIQSRVITTGSRACTKTFKGGKWYDGYGNETEAPPSRMDYERAYREKKAPKLLFGQASSTKPTKSENIDPYGRTIKGTPGQLKEEARRHGVTIIDGPGA